MVCSGCFNTCPPVSTRTTLRVGSHRGKFPGGLMRGAKRAGPSRPRPFSSCRACRLSFAEFRAGEAAGRVAPLKLRMKAVDGGPDAGQGRLRPRARPPAMPGGSIDPRPGGRSRPQGGRRFGSRNSRDLQGNCPCGRPTNMFRCLKAASGGRSDPGQTAALSGGGRTPKGKANADHVDAPSIKGELDPDGRCGMSDRAATRPDQPGRVWGAQGRGPEVTARSERPPARPIAPRPARSRPTGARTRQALRRPTAPAARPSCAPRRSWSKAAAADSH